jgi:uncharacterized protein YhdP
MEFTRDGLSAQGLQAELFGNDVTLDIATTRGEHQGYEYGALQLSARGAFGDELLQRVGLHTAFPYIEGNCQSTLTLTLPAGNQSDGLTARARFATDLAGIAVKLPPPLAKAKGEHVTFTITTGISGEHLQPLFISYGDRLQGVFQLRRDNSGLAVERGRFKFGVGDVALPSQAGIAIAGHLSRLDVGKWVAFISDKAPDQDRARPYAPGWADMINHVDLSAGEIDFYGQRFDIASLLADRNAQAWDVSIKARGVNGRITIPYADTAAPVTMDLEMLRLTGEGGRGGVQQGAVPDPRNIPPLRISAKQFSYADMDFGSLKFESSAIPGGMHIDTLQLASLADSIQSTGDWIVQDGRQLTRMDITVNAGDLGKLLKNLGYSESFAGGETKSTMKLYWYDTPMRFSLARLNGSMKFDIRRGRLLSVKTGAGRVFGLLSIQALPRRLILDFSDLFNKGFSFDRITGAFEIDSGNAFTTGLVMQGPSAQIDISGRTGLAAKDYDQLVTVTPKVSSTLPMAGVLVGGPVAGGLLLAIDRLFSQKIDQIGRYQYTITGTWDAPVVKPLQQSTPSLEEGTP